MHTIETFKAYCTEQNREIVYGVQTINDSRNRIAKTKTCSNSDHCAKSDCCCKDGNQNYIKTIKGVVI